MAHGRFIVLEGGEGCGKSTQIAYLAARLRARGDEVVETFEPGATARGARLRSMLLDDDSSIDPRAELLLMAADRAQHVSEVVRPALARGAVVVSDRFVPSSLAYQGVGRGLGVNEVLAVSAFAQDGVVPDLVIVLDVSSDVAAQRRPEARDRMERSGVEFHETVRAAYRDLAERFGWVVVDGSVAAEAVAALVWAVVASQ